MLTQAFVSSACYLFVGLREFHRPALLYRHKELEGFYGFGLYQMGERSVNYISAHIDKLLIGKMVGMQALGFYEMAWRLIIFPLQKINPIINKVAFPVYAMVQNDRAALEKYYSFNVKALSLVITPILAFLAFFSCDVVLVVFGEGWEQTASLIAILAFVGVGKALGNPGGALILAKGRADIGFWWNIFWSVVVSITLFTVLFFVPDIEMVAYALLGLSLSVGLIWHYLISKIRQIRYLPIALHFCRIILVCFGIAWAVSQLENFLSVEIAIVRIAMGGFICLLIYLPYLWFFEKEIIKRLRKDS
jgi:O-antigen/teichoic acid export membrane protein